jgi:formate dehydrogenase major subunit
MRCDHAWLQASTVSEARERIPPRRPGSAAAGALAHQRRVGGSQRRTAGPRRAGAAGTALEAGVLDDDPDSILGTAPQSRHRKQWRPRTAAADKMVRSVCPYCAVGCGQRVYVKDEQIIQIEGDPDSPISRGRLCPKGSASKSLVTSPLRETKVKYRRPHGTEWEELELETAMDMIAERILRTRERTWEDANEAGQPLNRTLGMAFLGGATLDTEENYLIKKCFTAAGAISIENQARI